MEITNEQIEDFIDDFDEVFCLYENDAIDLDKAQKRKIESLSRKIDNGGRIKKKDVEFIKAILEG